MHQFESNWSYSGHEMVKELDVVMGSLFKWIQTQDLSHLKSKSSKIYYNSKPFLFYPSGIRFSDEESITFHIDFVRLYVCS